MGLVTAPALPYWQRMFGIYSTLSTILWGITTLHKLSLA
ncbi:hypothetical protein P20495_4259 [Pseudoalteromonas sp. BSi20495]|nr:hypothetical protein P20495_4259 [Pseudoalteromonas sp. BSi20495]